MDTDTLNLKNRCLDSKSPYVRSHASNPTAWQLWSPETLALARRSNRLLFVSIGYSACHWCHVMAKESFNNPHIADLINSNFIPVKLDREERPDIDRVYIDFLQATSGGGGWPLNVFVTPDLQPIFGGTYWPGPESVRASMGAASCDQILRKLAQAWKEQESRCRYNAAQITAQLKQFSQEGLTAGQDGIEDANEPPELELLEEACQHYLDRFDDQNAGFGGAPKFPTPTHLGFLLRLGQWDPTVSDVVGEDEVEAAQEKSLETLSRMALGGINDQLGNGFARYSVTRDWSLPHFEKMLYDNAQLLPLYTDAWLLTKSDLFLSTALGIATYLTSPPVSSSAGAFHASEDADSAPTKESHEHKEGAFYVWTAQEFRLAIGDERAAAICACYYNVKEAGNVKPRNDPQGELENQNTLCVVRTTAELADEFSMSEVEVRATIERSKSSLLKHRNDRRPRPHLDDKIVTAWNGLAISGLAHFANALSSSTDSTQASHFLDKAKEAAAFIKSNLYDTQTHRLRRVYREGPGQVPGFADDYAFLIAGLLDLYEASFDDSYLAWATELQDRQIEDFYDVSGGGGFFSTAANAQDVLLRSKDAMDNAEPSTNGASASNLFRLATMTGQERYEMHARQTVKSFEIEMIQHPYLFTGLLCAVVMARLGVKGLVIAGQETSETKAAVKALAGVVRPGSSVVRIGGEARSEWLREHNGLLKEVDGDKDMVQSCEGQRCTLLESRNVLQALMKAE